MKDKECVEGNDGGMEARMNAVRVFCPFGTVQYALSGILYVQCKMEIDYFFIIFL